MGAKLSFPEPFCNEELGDNPGDDNSEYSARFPVKTQRRTDDDGLYIRSKRKTESQKQPRLRRRDHSVERNNLLSHYYDHDSFTPSTPLDIPDWWTSAGLPIITSWECGRPSAPVGITRFLPRSTFSVLRKTETCQGFVESDVRDRCSIRTQSVQDADSPDVFHRRDSLLPKHGPSPEYGAQLGAVLATCVERIVHDAVASAALEHVEYNVQDNMARHQICCEHLVEVQEKIEMLRDRLVAVREDFIRVQLRVKGNEDLPNDKMQEIACARSARHRQKSPDRLLSMRDISPHARSALSSKIYRCGQGGSTREWLNHSKEWLNFAPEVIPPRPSEINIIAARPVNFREAAPADIAEHMRRFETMLLQQRDRLLSQYLKAPTGLPTLAEDEPCTFRRFLDNDFYLSNVSRLSKAGDQRALAVLKQLGSMTKAAIADLKALRRDFNLVRSDLELRIERLSWQSLGSGRMRRAFQSEAVKAWQRQKVEWTRLVEIAAKEDLADALKLPSRSAAASNGIHTAAEPFQSLNAVLESRDMAEDSKRAALAPTDSTDTLDEVLANWHAMDTGIDERAVSNKIDRTKDDRLDSLMP